MPSRTFITHLQTILFAAAVLMPLAPAHAGNPFTSLAGTWSGSGKVRLSNGKSEKLRCKAYYTNKSGGTNLGMSIRCASTSNKFNLRAKLSYAGGKVSGSWTETNYNASGALSGRASTSKINVSIQGGISGSMSVFINGRSQRVSMRTSDDTAFRGINISLRKRG
ncbi:MAG: hypothetical protein ACRBCJ_14315 [Hyphomicrobiaceae bacterium]